MQLNFQNPKIKLRAWIAAIIVAQGAMTGKIEAQAQDFNRWDPGIAGAFTKEIKNTGNTIWVGTSAGLFRYDKKSNKVTRYTVADGLPDNYITSIVSEPGEKSVWIGTPSGIAQLVLATGKVTAFTQKNSKLTDNRVNALYLLRSELFIGNGYGIDIFDIEKNQWRSYTAIEGLAGANIQVIDYDGSYIWAGGMDGISYYDPNEDFWDYYGVDNGLNSSLVTSLSIDPDAIWVGTMGGGVSRFDRSALRFEPYTTEEGLIDDSVQYLLDDGRYLWIGTFGGLSRMDKFTLVFRNYDSRSGLEELSITSGIISGEKIYAGTEGGGIFEFNKGTPQIEFLAEKSGYSQKGKLDIYGNIKSSASLKEMTFEYRQVEAADIYGYTPVSGDVKSVSVNLDPKKSGFEALLTTLNTSEMADGKYLIRISALDSADNHNESSGMVIVDNTPPEINLFFREPEKGDRTAAVSGTYNEVNLAYLSVKIGSRPVSPIINKQTRRFRFDYPVDSNQQIYVEAGDTAMNTMQIERSFIIDKDPPQLTIDEVDIAKIVSNVVEISGTVKDENIDEVMVMPDQVIAELTPTGGDVYRFSAKASIRKEGVYTYQVIANDKSGKTTTKTLEVNFVSKITIVEIRRDKLTEFTLRDHVSVEGNVLGPPLREFYALVESTGEKFPIEIRDDKSFAQKVKLSPGNNKVKIIKLYEDGLREEDEYIIESSNKAVGASFELETDTFSVDTLSLTGRYDRGITSVFVNDKKVSLEPTTQTFQASLKLKAGPNKVKLSWLDELGRVGRKDVTLKLDTKEPSLFVRRPPTKTGLKTVRIIGKISDDNDFEILGYPNVTIRKISPETGEFEADAALSEGTNSITIVGRDLAGNHIEKVFSIEQNDTYPMTEINDEALSDEVAFLRAELERLREELKNRPVTSVAKAPPSGQVSFVRAELPQTPGLYWVPMAGKIKSYSLTAKVYLGSEEFGDMLAAYNGKEARNISRVLVPNPQLFSLLSGTPHRESMEDIIRSCTQAMNQSPSADYVRKTVLQKLLRARLLKEVKEVQGKSIFVLTNGTGLVIQTSTKDISAATARDAGVSELLATAVSSNGITFRRVK